MLDQIIAFLTVRFNRDEEGATAVEYGVMVALIAVVVIAGAILLGNETCDSLADTSQAIATNGTTTDGSC